MPTVELTDEQVLDLIRQLPPERRRAALLELAGDAARREQRMQYAEDQLRRICAARGLEWDRMSEDARETFLDDLVHEDRGCRP